MRPKHGKQRNANSVSQQNTNGKRSQNSAQQQNRRNQTIPHKPLALGYDTTKAAQLLSQTECDAYLNNRMPVYEADTVWRIGYSEYWSNKVNHRQMSTGLDSAPPETIRPATPSARGAEPRGRRPGITHITVRGARQHNLRNISVSIPRNTLTVVTGLSGSGKSSLAFDTIYAEGQRRYVETLSAYARQFLDQMERPDVDAIDGLSPAISIEQKTTSRSPRSTVGTITEIYDYLRLLYASVGQPHCPNCARPISRQTAEQIIERIVQLAPGERITVFAPIVRGRKGEFREELEALDQQGFRARIDGEMVELTEGMRLEKRKNHTIEAVVDRIILKPAATPPENTNGALSGTTKYDTRRLEASVLKALQMANGLVLIGIQSAA